jgi:hypothetical protein
MTNNNDMNLLEMWIDMLDISNREHEEMKMMIEDKEEDHHEVNMPYNDHRRYSKYHPITE